VKGNPKTESLPVDRVQLSGGPTEPVAVNAQMMRNLVRPQQDKPDAATQQARDAAVDQALQRAGDNRKVEVKPEDFTLERAQQTLREQQQLVADLKSGKKLSETDGDALPFATIYARITEDMLKKAETQSPEEQKMTYGIINTFHKYYDVAHANKLDDMDGVWKNASDRGYDVTPGVTDEHGGFMHSLRAHVVSDLDRAMAQVLNEGVKQGHFKESEIGTRWKTFFNGELKDVFVDAQAKHRDAVQDTFKGSLPGWLDRQIFGVAEGREGMATQTILDWRVDAYDRAVDLLQNRDVDGFMRKHNEALDKTNETVEQKFLDLWG